MLPMVALLLAACGNDEDDTKNDVKTNQQAEDTTSNNTVDDTDDADDASDDTNEATDPADTGKTDGSSVLDKSKDAPEIPFTEFSLEVKYPTGEYSLDYEKEFSGEESELEDERKNSKIVGEEALNNLKPLLKKFKFDANSTDEQVKKQLFSIIKIDDDYTSIELEVKFHDNTEKKYVFNK